MMVDSGQKLAIMLPSLGRALAGLVKGLGVRYTDSPFAERRGSFTVEQVVCVGALRILASTSGCRRAGG